MGLDNPLHIAVLVLVLLLVFGAKRVPALGRSLGTGMREFREGITGSAPPPPAVETPHPVETTHPQPDLAAAPAAPTRTEEDTSARVA
jgi:sec-independent protein translocase protein TatA